MYVYLSVIYVFILGIFFIILRINIFLKNERLTIEWLLIEINRINVEFLLYIDWIRILFIRIVIVISSIILYYRLSYIRIEKFLLRYFFLVKLFVFSMILIIIRPNIFRILFGWDGLGLISFCLVVYYQNYRSYNSGIITVLLNRLGDVMILMVIGFMIMYGRWNIQIFKSIWILIIFLIIAGITKRAQIPFSTWLPRAIAAPTPVSALVHSSTLVTAGVYLMIRFRKFLMETKLNKILILLSVLTIFISGLIALYEYDLKKIIALSTLRQLGLIIMTLRIGLSILSFYHLLTHAIFKSLLFIRAGIIIHLIKNNQDIRLMGNLKNKISFTLVRFQLALMSLRGFPFFSGFYSKDLIMEIVYIIEYRIVIFLIVLISLIFTVGYSIRLIWYVFLNERIIINLNLEEDKMINKSMIILIILRVNIGSILNWLFFIDYVRFLKVRVKILTIFIIIIGILLIMIIKFISFIKIYYFLYFFSSIWFLNYIYIYIIKYVILIRIRMNNLDKIWIEYYRVNFFLNYIIFNNGVRNFKVFILIFWILIVILILTVGYLK